MSSKEQHKVGETGAGCDDCAAAGELTDNDLLGLGVTDADGQQRRALRVTYALYISLRLSMELCFVEPTSTPSGTRGSTSVSSVTRSY